MIRINLAAGRRGPAGRRGGGDGPGRGAAALAASLCLLGLGWFGVQARAVLADAAQVARETQSVARELQRLAPAAERLTALEARREQLAARAGVLDAWRQNRRSVAGLLPHVGDAVPEGVRLEELRQAADGIVLGGQALDAAAVSALAAGLEALPAVGLPVDIVDMREAGAEPGVRFEVRARLAPPAG